MNVLAKDAVVEHFLEGQVVAVLGRDGVRRRLRVHGDTAGFVQVNVRARVEDDRVRRLGQVRPDRELVGLPRPSPVRREVISFRRSISRLTM